MRVARFAEKFVSAYDFFDLEPTVLYRLAALDGLLHTVTGRGQTPEDVIGNRTAIRIEDPDPIGKRTPCNVRHFIPLRHPAEHAFTVTVLGRLYRAARRHATKHLHHVIQFVP